MSSVVSGFHIYSFGSTEIKGIQTPLLRHIFIIKAIRRYGLKKEAGQLKYVNTQFR